MKFRPLHDRVVVKRLEEHKTRRDPHPGHRSREASDRQGHRRWSRCPRRGRQAPAYGSLGDKVLFGKWSGTEVKIDDDELLIMKESDIMGILS